MYHSRILQVFPPVLPLRKPKRRESRIYTSVYITHYFNSYGIPESIVSLAKERSKVESLEILEDELTLQLECIKVISPSISLEEAFKENTY
ncbi:hypothetical protein [Acidianus sp. HS-5]|uniref:hypothetical protein n=1 Tax=Acidianus sp. HS-5 TaxID=2886040 RepID=UPI001F2917A6|nr:hypothetical protein [Acidianus sp. HS-5]BDC18517.1 hypothetical protein HS5_14070 [Acidianus sp. HS-5]